MMTTLYLVRHAQSAADYDRPESEWPLSALGRQQADALTPLLASLEPKQLYSSPYPRAIDTLKPFATKSGLKIERNEALRERKLGDGPLDDFRSVLMRAWADFDFRLPHCESSRDCQTRMVKAITAIANENAGKVVAIASHGNAIGLFLNSLDQTFGFDAWSRMGNPDLFKITMTDSVLSWDKSFHWSL